MSDVTLSVNGNIAVITFDKKDSKVNVLDSKVMSDFSVILDNVSGNKDIEGLLITSSKDGIFIAGADIKEIENITKKEEAIEKSRSGAVILNKLASLDIPTMAAINGACLGGGFELALACKYRTASFGDKVKIGLPEVNLGIIPGFGGTQRLPRLIGLIEAVTMIASGKIVSSLSAYKIGAVDRLFPDVTLLDDSTDFLSEIIAGVSPHREKKRKKKLIQSFLEDTPLGRTIFFNEAEKKIEKKTKGFYAAPGKALEVIKKTRASSIEKGLKLESAAFGDLAVTEISKNLIKVFYLYEEYKKYNWPGYSKSKHFVKKCGVIGAGVMGGGIAQLAASRGILTRLKDINHESLKTALKTAAGIFSYSLKRKKINKAEVEYKAGLISTTLDYSGYGNCGIIIEAVVEDMDIKKKVFSDISGIAPPETIIVSNTSTIPIENMAGVSKYPERVAGLHFFNPVNRMPLVEIIKTGDTNEKTLSGLIDFSREIGKLVIVVKDVPGFLINRILVSYLNEAGFLFDEGVNVERIDGIMRGFGMPIGPVELIDDIGIDVGYKVAKILEKSYGDRMTVAPALEKVKEMSLAGKKSGKGFYIYKGKEKTPNRSISTSGSAENGYNISGHTIEKRLIYVMINEAARCLEEGVADKPSVVDIGMIMGTGFPPFRAGILRYADSIGLEKIVKDLTEFYKDYGAKRFYPAKLLVDKAGRGEGFYYKAST